MRRILFHSGIFQLPRLSPTMFDPVANSVLSRAHLFTAVDSMRRNPGFKIVQESVKVCTTGMFSRTLHAQQPVTTNLNISPRFSPTICYRDANSVLTSTPFYSSINRLYAQNPVFEIVCEEGVKVFLHMYSGNVQQNPLCFTKEYSISPGSRQRCLIP